MSKFSLGVSIEEIERELRKALNACFSQSCSKEQPASREIYHCLKMFDKMLPQDLNKMLN